VLTHIWNEARAAMHARFTLVNGLLKFAPPFASGYLRGRMYRWAGVDIHSSVFLMGNIEIVGGSRGHVSKVHFERGSKVSTHVTINSDADVTIGENVTLGPFVRLYTTSHELGPGSQRSLHEVVARPITIEKGCWLAVGVTVLPGVTIGHGSVIAAGAVVDKDVPPDSYVTGVPAAVVRKLPLGNR
jgi:acetyltransferase-like isoleucine patch superfamily enzyme